MRIALDTHILVYWCSEPDRLSQAQQHAIRTITEDTPAIVADISLWEIAMLQTVGRLKVNFPLVQWLNRALAPPLVRVAEITPPIVEEVVNLRDWENRDPADRLIVATARVYGARLITNDTRIRDAGVVETI